MADSTTSALAAAAALDGSEKLPVVQGGALKRVTVAEVRGSLNQYVVELDPEHALQDGDTLIYIAGQWSNFPFSQTLSGTIVATVDSLVKVKSYAFGGNYGPPASFDMVDGSVMEISLSAAQLGLAIPDGHSLVTAVLQVDVALVAFDSQRNLYSANWKNTLLYDVLPEAPSKTVGDAASGGMTLTNAGQFTLRRDLAPGETITPTALMLVVTPIGYFSTQPTPP